MATKKKEAAKKTTTKEVAKTRVKRKPKLWEALIPVVFLLVSMIVGTVYMGLEAHVPLVLSCLVTAFVAAACGYTWQDIITAILDSIKSCNEAFLIIICVGILIGSWVWSGTMPSMVYYGLSLIKPQYFLAIGAVLTGIVGLATGSSWTASGTVGVALMGVAMGLGIKPAIAAGMIISGAYFGDKLSPLSDSTNVAAASAGTPLYEHVSAMMRTTIPSFCMAVVLYLIFGFVIINPAGYDATLTKEIQSVLRDTFFIHPALILPVLVVFWGAYKRIPAIPSLLLSAGVGLVVAFIFQQASIPDLLAAIQYGYTGETGNAIVDKLVTRGGIDSMMWTISLIMFALAYGGMLEKCGFVQVLLGKLKNGIKSTGQLVLYTIISGIICDVILTDQYLAIMIPGKLFMSEYDKRGLSRSFLSRTTEDGGTLWSPMIPWNGCGAYQAATLGVFNLHFWPYAFMNIINPIYAIIITYMGHGIKYKEYDGLRGEELKAAVEKKEAELAKKKK